MPYVCTVHSYKHLQYRRIAAKNSNHQNCVIHWLYIKYVEGKSGLQRTKVNVVSCRRLIVRLIYQKNHEKDSMKSLPENRSNCKRTNACVRCSGVELWLVS